MKKLPRHLRRATRHFGRLFQSSRRKRGPRRMLTSELLEAREMLAADVLSGASMLQDSSRFDVNGDGKLSPIDALMVIDQLRAQAAVVQSGIAAAAPMAAAASSADGPGSSPQYDFNGDGRFSPIDALASIDALRASTLAETNALVHFRLETTDLEGNPIDTIEAGKQFLLKVYVQDGRETGNGVFTAYLDVDYGDSANLVSGVSDSLTYSTTYPVPPDGGGVVGTSRLDNVGSLGNALFGLDNNEYLLFSATFTATGAGTAEFSAENDDAPSGIPNNLITSLYGDGGQNDATEVDPALIDYGTASITVLGAVDDTATVSENAGDTVIDVLSNDTYEGNLTILDFDTTGTSGTVALNEDGQLVYNPNGQFVNLPAGQQFPDSFTYRVQDAEGNIDIGTVLITVTGEDSPPTLDAADFTVQEHAFTGAFVGQIVGDDPDSDQSELTYSIIAGNTAPNDVLGNPGESGPVFNIDDDGNITVAAGALLDAEAQSAYTLTVRVEDAGGNFDTAEVTIAVQHRPLVEVSVVAKDSDGNVIPEGANLAAGEHFTLWVSVTDLRGAEGGIQLAYTDVTFNNDLADYVNDAAPIEYLDLDASLSGNVDTPGLLDEAGAATLGTNLQESVQLFKVEFVAQGEGQLTFTANPADTFETTHPNLGIGIDDAPPLADANDVIYDSTSFHVVAALTASDDAYNATEGTNLDVDAAGGVLANDILGPDGVALAVADPRTINLVGAGDEPLGTVTLNADGSFIWNIEGVAAIEQLAAGETLTTSFDYTLTDGQPGGTNPTGTVQLTVTGANDPPVAVADAAATTENASLAVDVVGNDTDIDAGDALSLADATLVGATLDADNSAIPLNDASANVAGGEIVFDPGADFDFLAAGETATVVVNYTVGDGDATADGQLTITVTGANDAPVAVADTAATTENASVTVDDVLANDTDIDGPAPLSLIDATLVGATLDADGSTITLATAAVTQSGGAITFDPGADFDFLAAGETATVVVNYAVGDGDATAAGTLTITVTGANDPPVAADQEFYVQTGSPEDTVVDTVVADDVDQGDMLAYAITDGNTDGLFAIDSASGQITIAPGHTAPAVETPYNLTVEVTDGDASDTATITILVRPNEPPEVGNPIADQLGDQTATQGAAFSFTFDEDTFNDPDAEEGDAPLSYAAHLQSGAALPAWLDFKAGTRTFSGTPDNGDVGTYQIEVIATDADGDSVSDVFALTVSNVNDAPTVATEIADTSVNEDDAAFSLEVGTHFKDIDLGIGVGEELTFTATLENGDPLPAWLTFDAATQTFTGEPHNGDVGAISVKVTATDKAGEAVSDTFTLTVVNVNDAPEAVDDAVTTDEDDAVAVDVIANDTVIDADTTLSLVDGATINSATLDADGSAVALDTAILTQSGNEITFNPGEDFNFLAEDETATVVIDYTVTDDSGEANATDDGQLTITITGTNDGPQAISEIADVSIDEDQADWPALDISGHFKKFDASDTLTFEAGLINEDNEVVALPDWLSFDPETGVFTADTPPTNDDVGEIDISVKAGDGHGGEDFASFKLTVNNTNDAPTADTDISGTTTKSRVLTGNLLEFIHDVDPNETLTVVNTGEIVLRNGDGATVTINADGTFIYDPRGWDEAQALEFGDSLEDEFDFTIQDAAGQAVTATFHVHVDGLDPSSIAGRVYIDGNASGGFDGGEMLLCGVTITLTGDNGFTAQVETDAQGNYKFENLEPATYTITQTQPTAMRDGGADAGTGTGSVLGAGSLQIVIGDDESIDATGYDFREAGLPASSIPLWMLTTEAPTAGIYVAVGADGESILTSSIGGWDAAASIRVQLAADLSHVDLYATNSDGDVYHASVPTNDPSQFMWVNYYGSPRQFVIVGSSADINLTLVSSGDDVEAAAAMTDADYAAAADAVFADEDWS